MGGRRDGVSRRLGSFRCAQSCEMCVGEGKIGEGVLRTVDQKDSCKGPWDRELPAAVSAVARDVWEGEAVLAVLWPNRSVERGDVGALEGGGDAEGRIFCTIN